MKRIFFVGMANAVVSSLKDLVRLNKTWTVGELMKDMERERRARSALSEQKVENVAGGRVLR